MQVLIRIFKSPILYLTLIIFLGYWVRLYKIDNPIADWHSWRQADTAAVSRNFYNEGFNPFYPRGDDLSAISETYLPNFERYRFVEFPIYNTLVYFAYIINGGVDEKLARLVNVYISLGSTIFIYLITRRYFLSLTGLMAAFLFATLPFNIFFSRVTLPEPILVFFSLGMFYFVDRWIFEGRRNLYLLSVFFTACAFLTKPQAIFYLLPLILSYYQKEKKLFPIPKRYFLFIIPALLPLAAWRFWISQHPEGIPRSAWLLNSNGIRFRPAFWRWIIGDRFGREILSVTGTVLFFVGLILKPRINEGWLLHFLAAGSFLFLIVFATGNVQHDYYQTFIIPPLVIFTARGFIELVKGVPNFLPRILSIPIAIFLLLIMFSLTWFEVRGLYQVNNWAIVEGGRAADQILPKSAIVVAPYGGDSAFLYHVNRPGVTIVESSIAEMIKKYNITHYVSVNYDSKTNWLAKKYTVLAKDPRYIVIDLTHENPSFLNEVDLPQDLTEPP